MSPAENLYASGTGRILCQTSFCDELLKEDARLRTGTVHAFRVPLYAYHKRVIVCFHGLNGAVPGPGSDSETISGRLNSLVVKTVHQRDRAETASDDTVFFCADAVTYVTAGSGLLHMVECFAGYKRQILPDSASARSVENLHATADGKERFAG